METLRKSKFFQWGLIILMSLLVLILMFPSGVAVFKQLNAYAVQFLFLFLALGLLFMVLKIPRLNFASFILCGILCLYLKSASNISILPPLKSDAPIFGMAHYITSNLQNDPDVNIDRIIDTKSDVVCIQEVTPDWNVLLSEKLNTTYPYKAELVRIDDYGQMIFSKFPIQRVDTVFMGDTPSLEAEVLMSENNRPLKISCQYALPTALKPQKESMADQYKTYGSHVQSDTASVFIGMLHLVTWSEELAGFMDEAEFKDSRIGFVPAPQISSNIIFDQPIDHIMYNDKLQCLYFGNVFKSGTTKIGIAGRYQLKN